VAGLFRRGTAGGSGGVGAGGVGLPVRRAWAVPLVDVGDGELLVEEDDRLRTVVGADQDGVGGVTAARCDDADHVASADLGECGVAGTIGVLAGYLPPPETEPAAVPRPAALPETEEAFDAALVEPLEDLVDALLAEAPVLDRRVELLGDDGAERGVHLLDGDAQLLGEARDGVAAGILGLGLRPGEADQDDTEGEDGDQGCEQEASWHARDHHPRSVEGGPQMSKVPAKEMEMSASGADIMRQFVPSSPFAGHLGLRIEDIQPGSATVAMPFTDALITIGTTIHGGAIASLIDTAAMVAAWSDAEVPDTLRGTTVGLTVTYLAAAAAEDLAATATVLRRGRNLAYLDVDVRTASGEAVAKGLVTYKIG
jgi:uncharacterized protein (TIGR00369 family)